MVLNALQRILPSGGGFVEVADPLRAELRYQFPARSRRIVKRARKMGIKEPGTIKWLHENLRADDTVLDIGANVGIYTAFVAARLGQGKVFAVEPHAGNFATLLETVRLNAMGSRVVPLNVALDSASHWIDFTYHDLVEGSSGSQLASSPTFEQSMAAVTEKKYAVRVDELINTGVMVAPDMVKIDVDGNELNILRGMTELLERATVRSMQIEVDPQLEEGIFAFLQEYGYTMDHKHLSARGAKELEQLGAAASSPFNAVFVKTS
jgi:FkbM family methyltransferase